VRFLFVYEVSPESLNRFAPILDGRHLLPYSDELEVKDHGQQGQKWHFSALVVACVQFMFGKTSLASSVSCY